MSELRFDGRVAVITGGGRGLGRAYALLLARLGAKVVVNDPGGALVGEGSDARPAEAVVAEITAAGGEAIASLDTVATLSGGAAIVQAAIDRWGRIDILIHNAGNVRYGSLRELSVEDFEAVLDVHLRGAFHVVRPAFPLMCEAGYGRIVLTSSIGGLYGNTRVANYGVAKAGLIGLSNVVALEGDAEGVKCNASRTPSRTSAATASRSISSTAATRRGRRSAKPRGTRTPTAASPTTSPTGDAVPPTFLYWFRATGGPKPVQEPGAVSLGRR
jgi:NAD(P)-dependent dehydrogenase (short-subunit alcohol dehydrogenase family)